MTTLAAILVVFVFGIPYLVSIIVGNSIIRGYVLSTLWGWFMVPLGLHPIGVALAIGVSLVIGLFTHQTHPTDYKKEDRRPATTIGELIGQILSPFFVLFVGYIVHRFFM